MAEFPTVEGSYRITVDWEIVLRGVFQRRFEEDVLVLWRPGLTARIRVSGNDENEPKEVRHRRIQEGTPGEASDVTTETNGALIRHAYRVKDTSQGERRPAFYGFAIGNSGHVQIVVDFDSEGDLATVQGMWRGLREVLSTPTGGCS